MNFLFSPLSTAFSTPKPRAYGFSRHFLAFYTFFGTLKFFFFQKFFFQNFFQIFFFLFKIFKKKFRSPSVASEMTAH
jgi:hypothetical protein